MARSTVDRAQITKAAYALAEKHGLSTLDIRSVAQACGVSVGTIYNYFPTKDDLVVAVIGSFWRSAFREDMCREVSGERFDAFVARMVEAMSQALAAFRSDWLPQARALSMQGRDAGRLRESAAFAHMRQGMLAVLTADEAANTARAGVTPEELVSFVFESMIASLCAGDTQCRVLIALLGAALYDTPKTETLSC